MYKAVFEQDPFFWFCALIGSGFFVIQILLSFFGSGESEEFESAKFKWLTKQGITGFLMMFGWTALACKYELGLSSLMTYVGAFCAGSATLLITVFIFRGAKRLHSSGTLFNLDQTIGREAIVYQQIPLDGTGTITVSIEGIARDIDAVALDREEIASFRSVQIVKKIDDTTVAVTLKK